jgi:hypothetical protein
MIPDWFLVQFFCMIKRFFDHRLSGILFAGVAVLLLVILAAALGNIHFQPGRPISLGESAAIQVSVDKIAGDIVNIPFWKQVVFWGLIFILVIIVSLLLSPEMRKRIILFFLRFALFALALFYILRKFRAAIPELNVAGTAAAEGVPLAGEELAPMVFTEPHISSTLLYLISLGVVLVLAVVAFFVGRWWLQRQRLRKGSESLEGLAEVARASLADISSGRNWENAIINCYARMSDVVDAQRGLSRRKDLTANEFSARLEGAGLPAQAVRRLTRLFEAARYGTGQASHEEMLEAVACLQMILHTCGVIE